ncbi:MAG: glucokinase [Aquimonas sp.]|nr:glucokinase [Aquimonas sp.]
MIHALAADIGGTNARLAWVDVPADAASMPSVLAAQTYRCADFPGLAEILQRFLADHPGQPQALALAVAGLRHADEILNQNLPWRLPLAPIRALAGSAPLYLSNDFEALARATRWLAAEAGTLLYGPSAARAAAAPVVVLGPGTGLGAALRVPAGRDEVVVPTEGGQAAFAPGNALEDALLAHLRARSEHVCAEALLSGPGLLNLYRALAELEGVRASADTPEAVGRAAVDGSDPLARRAAEVFWAALAGACGNAVLALGAYGGVLLAGGILPRLMPCFDADAFAARFIGKGSLQPVLERVPVRLIEHGQLGIVGAAMAVSSGTVPPAG